MTKQTHTTGATMTEQLPQQMIDRMVTQASTVAERSEPMTDDLRATIKSLHVAIASEDDYDLELTLKQELHVATRTLARISREGA